MNISQLAKMAEVSTDTVRYYEKQRLLPPPTRSASGYRHYEADDVLRLNFIRRAKVLGFTLDEIREARLAPVVDFKGRRRATPDAAIPDSES